ncbi:hypothetical protein TcG_10349 [Trypanosoma cruzi]|nr:hypothetical protein TcG_10349 [Trypanosoma cruzi]
MHLAAIKRPSTSISRQTPNVKGLTNKNADGLTQYIPAKDTLSVLEINTVKSQKPPHRAKNRVVPLLAMLCCPQTPPSVVFQQKQKKKTFTNQQQEKPPHATCASPWSIASLPASKTGAVTPSARIATNTPNCDARNTLRRDHRFPDRAAHFRPPCLPRRTHQACRCNAKRFRNTQRIPSQSLAQPPC